jgi:hypothetical protein
MRSLMTIAVAMHLLGASDYALAKGGYVRLPEPGRVVAPPMMVRKLPKVHSPNHSPHKQEKGHPAVTPPG